MKIIKKTKSELIIEEDFPLLTGFDTEKEYIITYGNSEENYDLTKIIGKSKYISSTTNEWLHTFEFRFLLNLQGGVFVNLLMMDPVNLSIQPITRVSKLDGFELVPFPRDKNILLKCKINELIDDTRN